MVLTQGQKAERAKVIAMQLTAATTQLLSLDKLIATEEVNEQPRKQMVELLTGRITQLESQTRKWIDEMFEVITEEDSSKMLQEVAAVNDHIQQQFVRVCVLKSKFPESSLDTGADTSQLSHGCQLKLPHLPEIQIPYFHGLDGEWEQFKELFVSVIDSRDDLDDLKKLTYLKGYCKDKAALTFAGISITEANYRVAWDKLKKNHEDLPLVISRLVLRLINLPAMTALTATQIQLIISQVSAVIINLKAVDQQLNSISNVLIVELVVRKLSPYLRELWQGEKLKEEHSTWEELESFLEKHRRNKQQLEDQDQQQLSVGETKQKTTRNMLSQSTKCDMCGQSHGLYLCEAFLQLKVSERVEFVGKSGLCFKCLETKTHGARFCQSNYGCSCRGNHHRLLHGGYSSDNQSQ